MPLKRNIAGPSTYNFNKFAHQISNNFTIFCGLAAIFLTEIVQLKFYLDKFGKKLYYIFSQGAFYFLHTNASSQELVAQT